MHTNHKTIGLCLYGNGDVKMNNFISFIRKKIKNFMERSRFFSRNTAPKVVSIIFALVMWLYVMGEVNPEDIKELTDVKVQLLNIQELKQSGLVISGQEDFTVSVKISGRRNDIYKVSPPDIVVKADLRGFDKGVNSVPLEVSGPGMVRIDDVSPKQIKISLDEIVKKQKPVMIKSVGTPVNGFEPGTPVISPSIVIVEGPETLVNDVSMVLADMNIENQQKDIKNQLPIRPVNIDGKVVNGVEVKTKYVDVTMPMLRVKNVPVSLIYEGKPMAGFKITQSSITPTVVKIKGPKAVVDGISKVETNPINIQGLNSSKEQEIGLNLPEGVYTSQQENGMKVKIEVEKIKTKEFIFKKEEITVEHLDDQYLLDLINLADGIKVRVDALESMISTIDKEDIQLYLNVKDLEEGIYSAEIKYNIPYEVEGVHLFPSKVDFEIKTKIEETNELNE